MKILHQFSSLVKSTIDLWRLTDGQLRFENLYGKILLPMAMQCNGSFCNSFYDKTDRVISSNKTFRENFTTESTFDFYGDKSEYYFYKEQQKKYAASLKTDLLQDCGTTLNQIMDIIKSRFSYIYIPKEIIPERFIQFETQEIQRLVGFDLISIVKKGVSESLISEIENKLKEFVRNTSANMAGYQFKSNSNEVSTLKAEDIYNFLAHKFFSRIEFKKYVKNQYVSMSQLSSGEKQQAIMALIYSTIIKQENRKLIIALDEPEASLHISERFDQFQKLYEISQRCCQVLFTSHWYGFIPVLPNGVVINVVVEQNKRKAAVLNVDNYRGEINNDKFPFDIALKGNNDLVQSIMNSVSDNDYNWIICEGVSDKIYLDEYLKDEITNSQIKLRIVSVIGCTQVENIYRLLLISLQDYKKDMKGKIFLLTDTDANINYTDKYNMPKSANITNVVFKRLVNDKKSLTTLLSDYYSSYNTPTAIEDVLNGKAFCIVQNKLIKKSINDVKDQKTKIEKLQNKYREVKSKLLEEKRKRMEMKWTLKMLEEGNLTESMPYFKVSLDEYDFDYFNLMLIGENEVLFDFIDNEDDISKMLDSTNKDEERLKTLNSITDNLDVDESTPSAFALKNVRISDAEKEDLKAILKTKKTEFARAYVEEIQKGGYKEPSWIAEIKKFFRA